MVKDVCFNGSMANTKYSSPVPLVGLYIAAASMVCALLVLSDVWAGFRRKKYWFPCRFFSFNSITLTLVSIAAKIPVDLTTNMPSEQDQLSKLCGTVFVCVCMSFMRPSLATSAEFESYANVTALSIFVITVVVNIYIQMATGVIFSFKAEHVIILICMLLLPLRFWYSVISLNALKSNRSDKGTELIKNGEENMLARLKLCYIYSYHSCLQLYACITPYFGDAIIICMMCSIVLVQATLRTLVFKEFKFCEGTSDYGWSMWWVFASQIFAVAVVTCAMGGRWFVNIFIHLMTEGFGYRDHVTYLQIQYLFSLRNLPKSVEKIFKFLIYIPLGFIQNLLLMLIMMVHCVATVAICGSLSRICFDNNLDQKSEAFEKQLSPRHVDVVNWVLKKGVADMERWMAINEQLSLKRLTCLLSNILPSRELSNYYVGLNGEGIRLSVLYLMVLVEIAKVVKTPINQDKIPLASILDEVFEIIHFIENKVNIGSTNYRWQSTLAMVIHKYGFTTGLTGFVVEQNWDLENEKVDFKFIQKGMGRIYMSSDTVSICLQAVTRQVNDLINYQPDELSEVVYGRIEQLFVDMLHAFLAQLPVAVFSHILESPFEEYQDRVRLGLGYMCKLQSIGSLVRYALPFGADITCLFDTQTSSTNAQAQGAQVQGIGMHISNIAQAILDDGEIQEDRQATGEQV